MSAKTPSQTVVPGALPGGLVRASFFDGMFLTQADLMAEQQYWRIKRRLTNRALGQGVVWGLKTSFDDGTHRFSVTPGYGIDCCGNDLVIAGRLDLRESDLLLDEALAGAASTTGFHPVSGNGPTPDLRPAQLLLEYVELPDDPRPMHKDACSPDPTCCEPARTRETSRLILVPPPAAAKAGALSVFTDGLDQLRQSLGSKTADLFPSDPGQAGADDRLATAVRVRAGDASGQTTVEPASGASSYTPFGFVIARSKEQANQPIRVSFDLNPPAGWVFYGGDVVPQQPKASASVAELNAPYNLHLAWNWLVNPPPEGKESTEAFSFVVNDLGFTRLFSGSRQKSQVTVAGRLTLQTLNGPSSSTLVHGCVDELHLMIDNTEDDSTTDGPAGCAGAFDLAFFAGADAGAPSPGGTAGALVLAALHAFLVRSLAGHDASDPAAYDGTRLAAVWIYVAAWRLIYGADLADPNADDATNRQALVNLLHQLFINWCAAFAYPGPRCPGGRHGVVLGTAMLDAAGSIASFDPWAGRRHVLTGPLLSHWGGQFGLAPLDVTVGRLVQAICCVAGADAPVLPVLPQMGIGSVTGSSQDDLAATLASDPAGTFAAALSNGSFLQVGNPADTQARLEALGFTVTRTETVSPPRFLQLLIGSFSAAPVPPAARRYVGYTIHHQTAMAPHLFLPEPMPPPAAAPNDPGREAIWEFLEEATETRIQNLDPVSRAPIKDFLVELTYHLPLTVATAASSLTQVGITTMGALLAMGGEAALQAAAGDSPPAAALISTVNKVYATQEAALVKITNLILDGVKKAFADPPLVRADLLQQKFQGIAAPPVQDHLKAPDASNITLCAAEAVVLPLKQPVNV